VRTVDRSDFRDPLHGIDIQSTVADRVQRVWKIFLERRNPSCSQIVPHTFYLMQY